MITVVLPSLVGGIVRHYLSQVNLEEFSPFFVRYEDFLGLANVTKEHLVSPLFVRYEDFLGLANVTKQMNIWSQSALCKV